MRRLLILFTLVTFFSSCSQQEAIRSASVVQYASLSAHPIMPVLQQTTCARDVRDKKTFAIDRFIAGELVQKRLLYQANIPSVTATTYDQHILYKVQANYNEATSDWEVTSEYIQNTLQEERVVPICKTVDYYKPNSIEAAAIATRSAIRRGYQAIQESLPQFLTVPSVALNIAPLLQTDVLAQHGASTVVMAQYQTDNAYYNAKANTITFLPSSEEGLKKNIFGGQFLWNIPMVAEHEYGHHIFQLLVPVNTEVQNINQQNFCFDNRLVPTVKSQKTTSWLRLISKEDVVNALSEGFADLFANYVLTAPEASLQGLPCLEINRDIEFDTFTNGDKKQFTTGNMCSFFSVIRDNQAQTCREIDYQDIHILGAIFAYQTNHLLDTNVAHWWEQAASRKKKLKYLLLWAKKLGELRQNEPNLGPQQFLQKSLALMNQLVLDKSLNKVELKQLNEMLPYSYGQSRPTP